MPNDKFYITSTGMNSAISTGGLVIRNSLYTDRLFNTIERNNCKILQYELIGLNENHITIKKNFINRTKTLFLIVKGEYEDELTGWKNDIDIKLEVDYSIYNKISWSIQDGILNIILYEIPNEEPAVALEKI